MPVLTVRISETEQAQLTRRAKQSGISAGALVRQLLNEEPFTTAAELLKGLEQRMGDKTLRVRRKKMKRHCLLDSSFVIDLLNEVADGVPGPALEWLRQHPQAQLWISAVTYAEVLEGADEVDAVRSHLRRYRWQGLHHAQADLVALLQQRISKRMGENDAWQAAVALHMKGCVVGHDPKAFERLGGSYVDHRRS